MEEAEALVIERDTIIDATGMLECVLNAYLVQAKIAACRRNIERVVSLLEQLENIGHLRGWARAVAAALLARLRLNLGEGRLAEATANLNRLEQLAKDYASPTPCAWSEVGLYALQGRAAFASAENRPLDAVAIWRDIGVHAESTGDAHFAVVAAFRRSGAMIAAGQTGDAEQVFCRALRDAAAAGLYQSVLDETPELEPMLLRAQKNAIRNDETDDFLTYIGTLIAGWNERHSPGNSAGSSGQTTSELSPRERNILECISQGRSNKEIGRVLGISPETVKTHIKNIFAKLAIDRRAHAVSRAKELGLINAS